jgi:uncharacterized protein
MFQLVEFPSEGAILKGRLYLPDEGPGAAPVVVMAHGTSATVPMVMDKYAEVFQAAGLVVLAYDHRNFGISGGEPRQEINPWIQARGFRDAISCVEALPGVDADRLALWGDSYSAGEAIVLASIDERIRAVIAQCPVVGTRPPPVDPSEALHGAMRKVLLEGDVTGTPETTTGPVPVVSFDQVRLPSLLKPLSAFRWFIEYGGRHGSAWVNDVTRVVPPTPVPFSPVLAAPYVKAPTMLMVAPEDEMVHCNPLVARRVFDLLGGEKLWQEIAGGHFGLLWHPGDLFDEASSAQTEFLMEHLT